jgi:hypothetical protein
MTDPPPRDDAKAAEAATPAGVKRPIGETFLQNDIDRAVDFRKEYYKYSLGISTALLAFTVSFPPNLSTITWPALIFVAWVGLGSAVVAGVFAHYLWARFFITWRDYDNKNQRDTGKKVRDRITWWRRKADIVLLWGVAIGVAGIVVFAGINLPNIAPKEVKAAAATSSTAVSTVAPPAMPTPGQSPAGR